MIGQVACKLLFICVGIIPPNSTVCVHCITVLYTLLHFDLEKFFQILTFVYAVCSVCVFVRGQVFAMVLHIPLHINLREGSSSVHCIVSLHVMHDILFKSTAVAFDFLAYKFMQKLRVWWGLGVIKCALSFGTIFVE